MRTRLVLLPLTLAGLAGLAGLGASACGGNDKPPLTPDNVDMPADATEAGAPASSSTSAPTPPAPAPHK